MKKLETVGTDTPSFLTAIKSAREFDQGTLVPDGQSIKIGIVTNFTDDVLKKSLTGLCVTADLVPSVYTVPYKQYIFELKNPNAPLLQHTPDVLFVFFDCSAYLDSEFTTQTNHVHEVLDDIETICRTFTGQIVIQSMLKSTDVQLGRLLRTSLVNQTVTTFNARIAELAEAFSQVHVISSDTLTAGQTVYDLRNLYTSSQPFTNDFLYRIATEWFATIRSLSGFVRKCLVVDLDNTLWGGVVGEVGPLGIALGPEYPGNAFMAFQRVLLQYYEQGIILAINSRNNLADVMEVFEKNPHMILKESHFACIVANWETKVDNLRTIAAELNIGLDSLVFIDDDAMNRDMVRAQLPEVAVPHFSLQPEEYAWTLLNLTDFHRLSVTDEDRARGMMYVAERKRKMVLLKAPTLAEYVASLDIKIQITVNNVAAIPRLAQLTQKTNQFNLTTKRMTETDVVSLISEGALVYGGEVTDTFGAYGLTIMAVITPLDPQVVALTVCLMSCRVMGRSVERAFFGAIARDLLARGYSSVQAEFIPTAKNEPTRGYLGSLGGVKLSDKDGIELYEIDLPSIVENNIQNESAVTVELFA
jgi:FkbH-like protein